MKTKLLTVAAAFLLFATTGAFGQNCDSFYPLKKGVTGEMTSYNAKDKEQSRVKFTVLDTKNAGGGIDATLRGEMFDGKGKPVTQTEYEVKCRNGNIMVDMSNMLNSSALEGMKDLEMKVETAFLEYPSNMKTGDKLASGKTTVSMSTQGREISTTTMDITNRRVTANEKITVPAGTFNAYKIEYDMNTHTKTMGLGKPITTHVKEWISPGNGVVRTETFNQNNKLQGYTVLSKLQK